VLLSKLSGDNGYLFFHCKKCGSTRKYKCNNPSNNQHPYNNDVWHKCKHKDKIARAILNVGNALNETSFNHIQGACCECGVSTRRYILGVWICWECYNVNLNDSIHYCYECECKRAFTNGKCGVCGIELKKCVEK
jgi:hypothetical protein